MCHVILRGFKGEKRGGQLWVFESSGFCGDGPEQVAHAFGEAANGRGCDFAACAPFRTVQQFKIWLLQSPLRREHEDRVCGDSLSEQVAHPLHACGGFSRPSFAADEEFYVKGRFNYLLLKQVEAGSERVHEARVQECRGFVNCL